MDDPCVSKAEDLARLPLPEPVFQTPTASEMDEYHRCFECAEGLVEIQPPDTNPKPWDSTFSPFGGACKMLGHENLLLAMYDDPELVHAVMDWLCRARIHYEKKRGALMGYDVKSIEKEWAEDDVNSPFISRALYEEFVFPYEQRTAQELGNIHYHSCGNITPFADLIITLPGLVQVDVSACSDLKTIAGLVKGRRIRLRKSPHVMSEVLEADEAQVRRNIQRITSEAQGVNTFILCEGFYDGQPKTLEKVSAWTRIAHQELLSLNKQVLP